jgi:hypothetical protein
VGTGLSHFGNAGVGSSFVGGRGFGRIEVRRVVVRTALVAFDCSGSDSGREGVSIGLVCHRRGAVGIGVRRRRGGIAGWTGCIGLAGESCTGLLLRVVLLRVVLRLELNRTGLMRRVGLVFQRHTGPVFLVRSGCKQ